MVDFAFEIALKELVSKFPDREAIETGSTWIIIKKTDHQKQPRNIQTDSDEESSDGENNEENDSDSLFEDENDDKSEDESGNSSEDDDNESAENGREQSADKNQGVSSNVIDEEGEVRRINWSELFIFNESERERERMRGRE